MVTAWATGQSGYKPHRSDAGTVDEVVGPANEILPARRAAVVVRYNRRSPPASARRRAAVSVAS